MKLGLINSAWLGTKVGLEEGIQRTKRIGFDTIDIFADPLDITPQERRAIRETAEEVGLPIVSLCCVAVGLIDFNPSVQRFNVERCKRFLDLCDTFRAQNLLLVIGEYIWQQEVIPPAAACCA